RSSSRSSDSRPPRSGCGCLTARDASWLPWTSATATRRGPEAMRDAPGERRCCSSALSSVGSSTSSVRRVKLWSSLDKNGESGRSRYVGGIMSKPFHFPLLALVSVLILAAAPQSRAASDDQPWVLDANNWQEGKDLLPEPVLKRLKDGQYWFKVVPIDPAKFKDNYSKKFWDLTEANEGKFDLDKDTCGIKDKATGKIPEFVAGLPFPKIDKNDPLVACKIAQNFAFAGGQGGGGGATFTLNGVDTNGQFRRVKAFIHAMGYQGRLD